MTEVSFISSIKREKREVTPEKENVGGRGGGRAEGERKTNGSVHILCS